MKAQHERTSRHLADGYDATVQPPPDGDDWLGLTEDELPIGPIYGWCVRPDCGAVVLFSGTVRDHADGRSDVEYLEYEAYDEMVVPKLEQIVADESRHAALAWKTLRWLLATHAHYDHVAAMLAVQRAVGGVFALSIATARARRA